MMMMNRSNMKEERDVEQSPQADLLISTAAASAPTPARAPAPVPEVESESIYENASELFQKTQL